MKKLNEYIVTLRAEIDELKDGSKASTMEWYINLDFAKRLEKVANDLEEISKDAEV